MNRKHLACGALLALAAACGPALAALTDLSNVPLANENAVAAKPNVLFLLDDSGSMADSWMPDNVSRTSVGQRNFQCNTIYYNPDISYVPPKNPNGTDFPQSNFFAAKFNGYLSTAIAVTMVDLSASFRADDRVDTIGNDTAQAAYYFNYTPPPPPGTPQTLTPTQGPCSQGISASPFTATGGGTWTKIIVGAAEQQNFANWYSYYRSRINMMKATGSRAFNQLTSDTRVGFLTINPGNPVAAAKFQPMADFDATQKTLWFDKLFATTVGPSTPLREALSRAGRYFAHQTGGMNAGMNDDPMQYSCQRNYTILVTDGYWNGTVTPVQIDGTTPVGNQDGNPTTLDMRVVDPEPPHSIIPVSSRPMYDGTLGSTTTTVTKVVTEAYSTQGCSAPRQKITSQTTTTTTTGGVTTTVVGAITTIVNCTRTPRALQNPNPKTTTTTNTTAGSGGSSNSLADVAQYYYITDLRPAGSLGAPVGSPPQQFDVGTENNVGPIDFKDDDCGVTIEKDLATWQHMTTFTMGLGLDGTLAFAKDYKKKDNAAGDFPLIRSGAKNWPTPVANDPTALDDLWHAAVNGRGQFFSAGDPNAVIEGLETVFRCMKGRKGSGSAASTSSQQPVPGDNIAFVAEYTTDTWTGELQAREIDLSTGIVKSTALWSAQTQLDLLTKDFCDNRSIKLFRKGATDNLVNFTWNTQACNGSGDPTGTASTGLNAGEQANFGASQVAALSQSGSMTTGANGTIDQKTAATGARLVNFLRGQRGNENFIPDSDAYYRKRDHVLGDLVNGQPVYVRKPFAQYRDSGYAAFQKAQEFRTPMVYVAGNDGMLHAFFAGIPTTVNGATVLSDPKGVEAWAFIPTEVLPNLHKLADTNYGARHAFSVDGSPEAGDVFDKTTNAWKTLLVGGFNSGGRGFYALDITDPVNPKGLWEFKYSPTCFDPSDSTPQFADCHVGLSFGNPAISKLADGTKQADGSRLDDGTWVVFATSGYNNVVAPGQPGDGEGYLYVLNAMTGQILYKIGTGAGDATTPSGLAKVSAWVDATVTDNTTQRVYGTDMLGNIWRFDVNDAQDAQGNPALAPAGREATLLATAKDPSGVAQPITVKPEITSIGSPPSPFVYIATGRYLGTTDLPVARFPPVTQQTQSIYAIRDPLSSPGPAYADLRASLKKQVITDVGTGDTAFRTVACASVGGHCDSGDGWYADLPDNGERVNIGMVLQLGTLVVASNIPENTACTVGGTGWLNFFDAATGNAVSTSPGGSVAKKLDSLIVGLSVVQEANKTFIIANPAKGPPKTVEIPIASPSPTGKRISWRELAQ